MLKKEEFNEIIRDLNLTLAEEYDSVNREVVIATDINSIWRNLTNGCMRIKEAGAEDNNSWQHFWQHFVGQSRSNRAFSIQKYRQIQKP